VNGGSAFNMWLGSQTVHQRLQCHRVHQVSADLTSTVAVVDHHVNMALIGCTGETMPCTSATHHSAYNCGSVYMLQSMQLFEKLNDGEVL